MAASDGQPYAPGLIFTLVFFFNLSIVAFDYTRLTSIVIVLMVVILGLLSSMNPAFGEAIRLLTAMDADLLEIVSLSLEVSLAAVALAALVGLPFGALLGVSRFPGRQAVIILLNALMGLPPVVVGLTVYLLLSRAGPLGWMGLLYTPEAMVIAQMLLVTPIIAALTRQTVEDLRRIRGAAHGAGRISAERGPHAALGRTLFADHQPAGRLRPRRG